MTSAQRPLSRQALMREVNDRIADVGFPDDDPPLDFVCRMLGRSWRGRYLSDGPSRAGLPRLSRR